MDTATVQGILTVGTHHPDVVSLNPWSGSQAYRLLPLCLNWTVWLLL